MEKIDEFLLEKLGKPLAVHLLTMWVGPVAGMLGGATLNRGLTRLRDMRDRRAAERLMMGMADSIVYQLVPLFEREACMHQANVEAVACALRNTLEGMVSSELVVARELDLSLIRSSDSQLKALKSTSPPIGWMPRSPHTRNGQDSKSIRQEPGARLFSTTRHKMSWRI